MPATTIVPLGASVLARRWQLDVNTGTHAAPTWIGVFGIEDFKPAIDPSVQDDSDYDSGGYKSSVITSLGWSCDLTLARKVVSGAPTSYNPGQEVLRAASLTMGASNRVEVRFYEMPTAGPRVEAYQGYAAVSWTEAGGAEDANATIAVTLTGQGARTPITHPDGAAVVPVLYSVTPATGATAGGSLHRLVGVGFFKAGVSDVVSMKIGVTNVPTYIVENDNEIVWLSPAKVAGPFVVYVTNSVGESITTTVTVTYS